MGKNRLEELEKQRQIVKSQLNSFSTFVNKINTDIATNGRSLTEIEIAQLEIRRQKVDELYAKFMKTQESIESETSITNLQDELNNRSELEDEFCDIQSTIKCLLNSVKVKECQKPTPVDNTVETVNLKSVKLPVIDLPKFDGNYNKWLEYRDTFVSVIHNNKNLDGILKFQYLKSSLVGEAAKIIHFLETSAESYGIAWNLVCERYNKPRLLVSNHMKALFSIKPANLENPKDIRSIVNEATQHLRALKLLEQPVESWDSILVHLLTSKLDLTTLRDWESKIKDNEVPTKEQLFSFLNERADTLENLSANTLNRSQPKYNRNDSQYKGTTKVYLTTNNSVKCSFCNKAHKIVDCTEFVKLPIAKRKEQTKEKALCINCLRPGHFIRNCQSSSCKKCGQKHHTLLHIEVARQDQTNNANIKNEQPADEATNLSHTHCSLVRYASDTVQTLLATALVDVKAADGKFHRARALLDSGSQSNLITSEFCNLLGLAKTPVRISLSSVGTITSKLDSKCSTTFKSRNSSYSSNTSFFVVSSICNQTPNFKINNSNVVIPANIELADPYFRIPDKIDILLGASVFWQVLKTNQIRLGTDAPILQQTKLGYIVSGPIPRVANSIYCNFIKVDSTVESTVNIQDQLSQFWELEECSQEKVYSSEEKACESHFEKNTKRNKHGRFIVTVPLTESVDKLGESKQNALKQFYLLENRLDKNQSLKALYKDFMQEYLELEHMSETNNDDTKSYFMPHHGVLKEENLTTKLRVVFNASSPTTSGVSFNDIQMTGPTIQNDLFSILIRFREHAYVVCADVSKMYRQILVTPEQRSLQKILWRSSRTEPVKEYCLNTVTYGTKSAPYLAVRCIFQLALENSKLNNTASIMIKEDMYVDDLITGDDDLDELTKNCNIVGNILQSGGFTLRKWKSNEASILDKISSNSSETFMKLGQTEKTKTLGVLWSCSDDQLVFDINTSTRNVVITKRILLSAISQIFDPLGLLAACTIMAKILLQRLWLEKLSWDDPVPEPICTKWRRFEYELQTLNKIKIPRYVSFKDANRKEIHVFCDASRDAYGACVYIRTINTFSGQISSNLLCAKSKVAPLKPISTPRLELCAALIGARLINKILIASRHDFYNCILWSDSTIVLAWIKTAPNLLKCFVSNRVAEIQDLTKSFKWRYVHTKENPADILSRGISPSQIHGSLVWWHGPDWLSNDDSKWPEHECEDITIPESRINVNTLVCMYVNETELFSKYSDINQMKRIIAYCFRFIYNCKSNINDRQIGSLTCNELDKALHSIIRVVQIKLFPTEYECLMKDKTISKSSTLLSLKPFLDSNNLMRVGGRLQASSFSYEKIHPIILPKGQVSELLFRAEHVRLLHAGPQQLLYSIRERFWPISGRNTAKKVVRNCLKCFRVKPRSHSPIMGNLPSSRVNQMHPFSVCGVDYAGPFTLKTKKGRGAKQHKSYLALFVCFVSKAVHLELVTDLTKDAFIAAFRRFVARRGLPTEMNSDNGTCFVGASHELNELGRFITLNREGLEQAFNLEGVKWRFIPPRSPHMGGLWEAAIRSAKGHIKRVAGNIQFTYEEFCTLLCQIEAVLNSRPLSVLSSDPLDPIPLTPSHFLIGRVLTSLPDPDLKHVPENRTTVYQRIQQTNQHFWTRWSKEYISEMQQRTKWKTNCKDLKIDTIVLLKEDNVPSLCWPIGVVTSLHPGKDGVCRVATVRTAQGIYKRPVVKLCPLPSEECSENSWPVSESVVQDNKPL